MQVTVRVDKDHCFFLQVFVELIIIMVDFMGPLGQPLSLIEPAAWAIKAKILQPNDSRGTAGASSAIVSSWTIMIKQE